ncbi:Protein of unknown function (DUF938) [Popillia japonica]|uniref:Methyltransferase-like 26 n=1 Tax=Popillia japonica TaxID=7064 RepID=A0AAW1NLR9_POPJA
MSFQLLFSFFLPVKPFTYLCRKISYPACERNRSFILNVLQEYFNPSQNGHVLEIGSGTGQHISYFANFFPHLKFQPSEYDEYLFNSIEAYAQEVPTKNVRKPVKIDITTDSKTWNLETKLFDYMLNINMMHISPYNCTTRLFQNASEVLKPGGMMITYGPYAHNGIIEPQSNIDFDKGLRRQNPEWGLRDINDLQEIAEAVGMRLVKKHDLPANNKCLIWLKPANE